MYYYHPSQLYATSNYLLCLHKGLPLLKIHLSTNFLIYCSDFFLLLWWWLDKCLILLLSYVNLFAFITAKWSFMSVVLAFRNSLICIVYNNKDWLPLTIINITNIQTYTWQTDIVNMAWRMGGKLYIFFSIVLFSSTFLA